jgi:hypothetical protein
VAGQIRCSWPIEELRQLGGNFKTYVKGYWLHEPYWDFDNQVVVAIGGVGNIDARKQHSPAVFRHCYLSGNKAA